MPSTIDWAERSPSGGRFGRLKDGLSIACALPACASQWGTGEIDPEGKHQKIALLWQQPDGSIVHSRCAPEEEKSRYAFQLDDATPGKEPEFSNRTGKLWTGLQHGSSGPWLFHGARYFQGQARYDPILWRRADQQQLL